MKKIIVLFLLVNFVVGQNDYQPCQFFVHYAIDNSNSLSSTDYQTQLNFVSNTIGTLNHGERIEISSRQTGIIDYGQQTNISIIQNQLKSTTQILNSSFFLDQTLKVVFGKISSYPNFTMPKIAFIFISDTGNGTIGSLATYMANEILNHDYQLNFVLMGSKAKKNDLTNFAVNFIFWTDLQQSQQPDSWTTIDPSIYSCRKSDSPGYSPCQNFIGFAADVSKTLTSTQFQNQLQFISSVIGGINHPERIMFSAGTYTPIVWNSAYLISDIQSMILQTKQINVTFSLALSLKSIYGAYLFNPNTTVPMAAVIFISDTSNSANLDGAQFYADALIRAEIKLTFILMGNNVSQNLLTNMTNNFVIWNDLTQQQPDNWGTVYGSALGCTGPVSTLGPTSPQPTTVTSLKPSTMSSAMSSSASITMSSTVPTAMSSLISSTGLSSGTASTGTTPTPYVPCQSFISFCVDDSKILTSADFQKQINFAASEISKLNYAERLRFQAGHKPIFKWENLTDINDAVAKANSTQQNITESFQLKFVLQDLYLDVIALKNSSVPRAAVIFVTDTTTNGSVDNLAVTVASALHNAGVRLTLVLVGNNVDQAKLVNISTNFVVWTDLSQNPPTWDAFTAYDCMALSTIASSTIPSTNPTTIFTGSTTPKPFIPCQSYIAFVVDRSNALSAGDFTTQINFLSSQVSSITHIERLYIQAGTSLTAPFGSHNDNQLQQLLQAIADIQQGTLAFSLTRTLQFLYNNFQAIPTDGISRAAVIFVTDTTNPTNYQGADQYATMLKNLNVRLTFVLTGNKVDQNLLTNLTDNFAIWNDLTQPQPNNWEDLSGPAYGCGSTPVTGSTSVATTKTRSPITVQSTQTFQPGSSTTVGSSTLAPPVDPFTCNSHIPFGIDSSLTLSTDQFTNMKNIVLDPFLVTVYPIETDPTYWVIFSTIASASRKAADLVALRIQVQALAVQGNIPSGSIKPALNILNSKNVLNNTDTLPVNTILFTGSSLPAGDVAETQGYVTTFTANGNTVIVVLMKDGVDQTNYNKIDGLQLVQYNSDRRYIISDLEKLMKCSTT